VDSNKRIRPKEHCRQGAKAQREAKEFLHRCKQKSRASFLKILEFIPCDPLAGGDGAAFRAHGALLAFMRPYGYSFFHRYVIVRSKRGKNILEGTN